jgi:hypothetical protein
MKMPALEEVASAADGVADDQRRVAQLARTMQRRRQRGWSWSRIILEQPEPGLLDLLRRSRTRLAGAISGLVRTLASGLAAEGATRRQIAGYLGVSHQRVTAVLNHRRTARDRDR